MGAVGLRVWFGSQPCQGAAGFPVVGLVGGAAAHGPVFKVSLASMSPLQKGTVACRLKRALERAGVVGAGLYAAHSLRRGGATHAAKVGVPLRFVQLMGRWKSDAVRLYMYASPSQVWQQSARML
jgi:integrase